MSRFTQEEILQKFKEFPIVPVFYHPDLSHTQQILQACYAGGLRVFEYTNRGEKAKEVFKDLCVFVHNHCPELALGIGTIYNAEDAQYFVDKGADFIVQPVCTADVAEICQKNQLLWIPGVMTLNEIYQATQLGAETVKIFPASTLGTSYIKAIKAPMPNIQIMVTGGVEPNEKSLKEWFEAGVMCVGIGSQLFSQGKTDSLDCDSLQKNLSELMQFVNKLIEK